MDHLIFVGGGLNPKNNIEQRQYDSKKYRACYQFDFSIFFVLKKYRARALYSKKDIMQHLLVKKNFRAC